MNNEMAESQIKEESSLKSKIEELKRIWKIDETIKKGAYFISKPENLLPLKPLLMQR